MNIHHAVFTLNDEDYPREEKENDLRFLAKYNRKQKSSNGKWVRDKIKEFINQVKE